MLVQSEQRYLGFIAVIFTCSGIANDMHFISVKNRELTYTENKSTIKSGNMLPGQQEGNLLFGG